MTVHSFRNEAAKSLVHLLNRPESRDCLIALPPSGLMGGIPAGQLPGRLNECDKAELTIHQMFGESYETRFKSTGVES